MTPSAQVIPLDRRYTMGKWFKVKLIIHSYDEFCKILDACNATFGLGFSVPRYVDFKTRRQVISCDTWAHDFGDGVFVFYFKTSNDLTKLMLML